MSDKNSGKEGAGAHKEVHKKTHQNQGYKEPKGHRQQKESGIAGVPILDCPNGITSVDAEWNFIAFKEGMAEYIEATHGDIACIFRTNEYPVYEQEIYDPADYTEAKDPLGLKKDALRERIRRREKKIAKLEDIKPMVYSIIKRQLSRQSQARVQAHNDFEVVDNLRDPNRLWQIVISTHLLNVREKDAETARTKAQMSFSQCRMQAFESLADFKTRFELRLHIYTTTWKAGGDCEIRISDATAATYFIEKLDPERYGTTQLNYRNKVYDKPRSVQEAFEFLNTLTIPKKSVRNVFYQNGQSDRDGERTKSNGGRRGNQSTGEQTESKKKKGPSAERPCLICGAHDHWVKDCPDADKDESKTSSKKEKNQGKKRTSLLVW